MSPELGRSLVYLSRQDVIACALGPAEILAAVQIAVEGLEESAALGPPSSLTVGPTRFLVKTGATGPSGHAAVKWFALGGEPLSDLPGFWPLILLSDVRSGYPLCLMDGSWITGMRTAALTALAARALARPQSARIGFVGCGVQARSHLAILRQLFPLREVVAVARRRTSAETFCAEARTAEITAKAVEKPREAVEGCDIVVTTVPSHSAGAAFLDGSWLAPGSFVAMVERGFSWKPDSLGPIDRVFTDDMRLSGSDGPERLVINEGLAGDLAQLVRGEIAGRRTPEERTAFAFSGTGIADAAAAAAVYRAAVERSIGTLLPL